MKISRTYTKFYEYRFNNTVRGNVSDHDVILRNQTINKMKKFKSLGSIGQKNGGIVENIANRIRCGLMKWQKATKVLRKKIPLKVKGKSDKTVVIPIMMYRSEHWEINKRKEIKMNVVEMKMLK